MFFKREHSPTDVNLIIIKIQMMKNFKREDHLKLLLKRNQKFHNKKEMKSNFNNRVRLRILKLLFSQTNLSLKFFKTKINN